MSEFDPVNWDLPEPFTMTIDVRDADTDRLGHANNVVYVRWLEDISWQHIDSLGMTWELHEKTGKAMAITRTEIDYLASANAGDRLVLGFKAADAGRHRILAHLTKAPDYGIVRILVNGKPAGEHDLYHTKVVWVPVDLGIHDLRAADNTVEVVLTGANENAEKRHMFGLDCLLLKHP